MTDLRLNWPSSSSPGSGDGERASRGSFVRNLSLKGWTLVVLLGALVTRLGIFLTYDERPPGKDSREYLALADQLASGGGFPRDGFRTPGYPAFLAVMEQLPGRTEDAVIVVQHLLGVALVVAMLLVAWHFFGKAPAILAAGLAALTPGLATLENWVLADFLFGCLVFLAVALLAYAVDRGGSTRLFLAAGVAIAAAAYVKPAGQFLVLAAPLGILLATRDLRSMVKGTALVGVAFAVAVAPWVIRTATHTGQVALSTQAGITIFNRAFEFDRLPVPRTEPGGPLLRRMQIEIDENDGRCVQSCIVPTRIDRFSGDSLRELTRRGYTRLEALRIQRRLAVEAIRDAPFSYTANTAKRTLFVFTDANRFLQYDLQRESKSYSQKLSDLGLPAPFKLAGLAWIALLQTISWVWLVLGLCGLLPLLFRSVGRTRTGASVFAAAWLTIALLTAATHGGLWRYSMSLAPLTWILGAAGAVTIVLMAQQLLRQRRGRYRGVAAPLPDRSTSA